MSMSTTTVTTDEEDTLQEYRIACQNAKYNLYRAIEENETLRHALEIKRCKLSTVAQDVQYLLRRFIKKEVGEESQGPSNEGSKFMDRNPVNQRTGFGSINVPSSMEDNSGADYVQAFRIQPKRPSTFSNTKQKSCSEPGSKRRSQSNTDSAKKPRTDSDGLGKATEIP